MLRHKNLTAAGSTLVNAGPGVVWTVTVGTAAATSNIQIFNASGASDPAPELVAQIDTTQIGSYTLGVTCGRGLYVTVTGTPNVTIGYV